MRPARRRLLPSTLATIPLLVAACSGGASPTEPASGTPERADTSTAIAEPIAVPELVSGEVVDFGPAPAHPDGPLDPELAELMDELSSSFSLGLSAVTTGFTPEQLDRVVEIGDARSLWILADLLRFPLEGRVGNPQVRAAFEELSGVELSLTNPWTDSTDHLIAWDLPAPPGYLDVKRSLYTTLEPKWEPLFADDAAVDWRHVGWGGVLIDDRILGNSDRCERGCIPALDDPAVTDADGGDWYPDDAIVFGIEIDGEARAYPKNLMEVHEMVNDTLGGRRIAVPYCTLCGSAQAYLTDELADGALGPEAEDGDLPIMRTSGLLTRSNKMMFELRSLSLVDTFLGVGTSGPLQGVEFDQVSVATSTWGEWKAQFPDTTIVAEDGGIGRSYPEDPLRGRDDDGPIFPIGAADPRLPVQEPVLGVVTGDGRVVAIHVAIAAATLANGETITIDDLTIESAGDGIRAVDADGADVGGHQAFWFAWSQFQPDTLVWPSDF